ncbi:ATP-dependent nuclease [Leuconostoc citreum]|uniref:ATP-dependent nuclease n=1 Tax=Leuconostoc citreum TaxID=33964 RepID=UPI0015DAE4CD|nr:AAA family ATPase [Leuconostoc citreum]
MRIKKLHLLGFKSYKKHTTFTFNESMNIIVGDNGVGKSTILEGIETVLRLKNNNSIYHDDTLFANYINISEKIKFESNKTIWSDVKKLPKIIIIAELELNTFIPKYLKFNGNYIPDNTDDWGLGDTGIYFEYKFDEDYSSEYLEYIKNISSQEEDSFNIPFEFYKADWRTFGSEYYKPNQDPLKSIIIDNSNWTGDPFNAFAKQLFRTFDVKEQKSMKTQFRKNVSKLFSESEDYKLQINPNITKLESILDVTNNQQISIRHLGSGKENQIKTSLALENQNTSLVLIEEPENHLSSGNTRSQINNIKNNQGDAQLIVTTHNSQIVTKLGIKNIIWIQHSNKDDQVNPKKFDNLSVSTRRFFDKKDDLNFLSLINYSYTILVEGAAEYILMQTFIKKVLGESYDTLYPKIEVISFEGRFYDPFAELSQLTNGKTLILTDNDHDSERIKSINTINDQNKDKGTKIFFGEDTEDEWTFEACIYKENKDFIENNKLFTQRPRADDDFPDRPKRLNYMLKHKTEVALEMIRYFEEDKMVIPKYISEGIKWVAQS